MPLEEAIARSSLAIMKLMQQYLGSRVYFQGVRVYSGEVGLHQPSQVVRNKFSQLSGSLQSPHEILH